MPQAHISSSVPLTQNTAPVLEFRCLFTPDLKKKQKKWQDGRLKFHTFNKRIMVYDDRTNYVGDTHYYTYTLEEGEELELERGVLVEVGELIGKQDQDLGEILDSVRGAGKSARLASRAPERGARREATPGPSTGRYATPAPVARQMSMVSGGLVRPLSALLGTPQGHRGRALLPTTSPFEDRQNAARLASETPEPASKRRKVDSMPIAQPLWARTSLMQSGSRDENLQPKPIARELSYPEPIAPKARAKKTSEKPAKSGYAQKLTGAVLDLSSTQKTNAYMGRQPSMRPISPDANMNGVVTITGSRNTAIQPAPILLPVKRKPAPILPPKKTTEIVYPDSIAPKAKPRKTVEKASKAGYAKKLTGAALDLSNPSMANVHKQLQPSIRQPSPEADSDDDLEITDVQKKARVKIPIRPPPPARKPTPTLPPTAQKPAVPRDIVYPDSIPPKSKPKKAFEKKSKAGYAEKLTGAVLNLSVAPAASIKQNSQPTLEEEQLLARLAELRTQREAVEQAEIDNSELEISAPKPKKIRSSKARATPAEALHISGKENEESLFVEDDFMDIDAIVPSPPVAKAVKLKKAKAPRKKKQADFPPDDVDNSVIAVVEGINGANVKDSPAGVPESALKTSKPTRNASQDETGGNDLSRDNTQQSDLTPAAVMTSQPSALTTSGSLRIKAKPKRKMLMMQSLAPAPVARPAAMAPTRPAILLGASLPAQRQAPPEPSQATKTLTGFHEKQKELLEERRRKTEARKRIPIEIHSSPEPEEQADDEMAILSSLINLDKEESANPNASISKEIGGSTPLKDVTEVSVQPTSSSVEQLPSATPLSPQTKRSKPFIIEKSKHNTEAESEEGVISYTNIHPQRQGILFSRAITAPVGPVDHPTHGDTIEAPPQPSLPQPSPPAFIQQKERVKRTLATFPSASRASQSLEAAKSFLRRPPLPLFSSTDQEEPQSSLTVGEDLPEKSHVDSAKSGLPDTPQHTARSEPSPGDEDPPRPIRAAVPMRKAQADKQSSPDWPSDGPETEAPSPKPLSRPNITKALPVVESSDTMSCPDSQAEEGGFSSSAPRPLRAREFSAAEEERLANGHSVLIKIKSGIRSKEIIRPKSVHRVRNAEDNSFIGFLRPPLPIVRSRNSSFVMTEVDEEEESDDGVDEDEVMRDLKMQAEVERQASERREVAQRKTWEFREKKERERAAMQEMKEVERRRAEASLREEEEEKAKEANRRTEEEQKQAQLATQWQEKERYAMGEKKRVEEKKLADRLRDEEEERERDGKRKLEEQLQEEAEGKTRQEGLRLQAEEQERRKKKDEKKRKHDEELKVNAEKERRGKLAKETKEKRQEEQQSIQKEKDASEAKTKLEEQAKYDEMKQMFEKQKQEKVDEKLKAQQEQLRLSNLKLEEQKKKERLDKERQEKAELRRLADLRAREENEARQRDIDFRKLEDQRHADLRDREGRETEQLKRKEAADKMRQQRAVEAAAAKLASSASLLPRSLPRALQGMRADEAQAENGNMMKQAEYQSRVKTRFTGFEDVNTTIEHIDISAGGSCGEGDLILAAPKVSAFKLPAPRSQAIMQPQPPRLVMAAPNRSFNGFPTHLHAAMFTNNIITGSHDFSPTSTPPAQGLKIPSSLHLSTPSFKPFCAPKSVPIVAKKTPKTMKEIKDEQRAERENKEDLKRIPGWEEKGDVLTWEQGAWTAEAGDLFGWRPKAGDFDEE